MPAAWVRGDAGVFALSHPPILAPVGPEVGLAELPGLVLVRSDDPVQATRRSRAWSGNCSERLLPSSTWPSSKSSASVNASFVSRSQQSATPCLTSPGSPHIPQHSPLPSSHYYLHLHPCPTSDPVRPALLPAASSPLLSLQPILLPTVQSTPLLAAFSLGPSAPSHLLLFSPTACYVCAPSPPACPVCQVGDTCLLPPSFVFLGQSWWRCCYSFKKALPATCP